MLTPSANSVLETLLTSAVNSTLMIDLTTSWTNATVNASLIRKPDTFPLARRPMLWADPSNNSISSFGGWVYDYSQDMTMWSFPATGAKHGPWTVDSDQPQNVSATFGSLYATSSSTFYTLGGVASNGAGSAGTLWANPNIGILDFKSSKWTNESSAGFGSGFAALGQAQYVPTFGTQGIIVYLGGFAPSSQAFTANTDGATKLTDMSSVHIYDIASKNFLFQEATGSIPPGRWSFCMVGAEDSSQNTFDM